MSNYIQGNIFDQPEVTFVPEKVSFTPEHNKGFENNESLQENRLHFESQAKYVLEQLMKGRVITGVIAMQEFFIQDLRARIYGLTKAGIQISKGKVEKGHGAKTFFMTQEQIAYNREKLKC